MTFHQSRPPLTPIELARRTAVLSAANQPPVNQSSKEKSPPADTFAPVPDDVRTIRLDGGDNSTRCEAQRCAGIRRREVCGIRSSCCEKLGEAVTGQWLPKQVMVDRLTDIAEAHGSSAGTGM